jgi:hypothetical protein
MSDWIAFAAQWAVAGVGLILLVRGLLRKANEYEAAEAAETARQVEAAETAYALNRELRRRAHVSDAHLLPPAEAAAPWN